MRRKTFFILAGDCAGLILFAFSGQRTHQTLDATRPLLGVLATAAPFIGVWLLTALVLKTWRLQAGWRQTMGQLLLAWLVAAPLALVLRALLLQHPNLPVPFVLATLGFGLLILGSWRTLIWLVWGRHSPTPT